MDDRRQKYSGVVVMLDDRPAKIIGYRNAFATVATIDRPYQSFEWSWSAVERIVANGGNFRS